MQGAGLCNNVTDVDAIAWNADIRPVLTHWISCIHVRKLRQLLILAPWIWGGRFYAMALVPDCFAYIFMNMHACGKLYDHNDLGISIMYHF